MITLVLISELKDINLGNTMENAIKKEAHQQIEEASLSPEQTICYRTLIVTSFKRHT
jgi:hypothetical protein